MIKKLFLIYLFIFSYFSFSQVECISADTDVNLEAGGAECNDQALQSDRDINVESYTQMLIAGEESASSPPQPAKPSSGAGAVK